MRLKVLWVFLGGIILPTGFLIYLGLASIRSESLLLRREVQERVGASAEAMRSQAESTLRQFWEPYELFTRSAGLDARSTWTPADRASLDRLRTTVRPAPVRLIVLDGNQRMVYPFRETSTPKNSLPTLSPSLQSRLTEAERLEFSTQEGKSAVTAYRSLATDAPTTAWRAAFFIRAAGVAMKRKEFDEARDLYREVRDRYALETDAQGFPSGLLATLQIADLLDRTGHSPSARETRLSAIKGVLTGDWPLSWTDEQFFIDRLVRLIPELSVDLQTSLRQRREAYASARQWVNEAWPALQQRLRKENRANLSALALTENIEAPLLIVPILDRQGLERRWTLVSWMKGPEVQDLVRAALDATAGPAKLAYRLQNAEVRFLSSATRWPMAQTATLSQSIQGIVPRVGLEVASLEEHEAGRMALRRKRIAIGIVLLAALVIGVALYTTWVALSREMEVAQLKARFVASVSHELKTPLSIIDLIGQKLKMGRYSSPAEINDFYGMLTEETSRLKGLIDEVLDFSRLMENRAPYALAPMDWIPLIRQTIERFLASTTRPSLTIPFETSLASCLIRGNSDALARVLLNFLDNAVKYSPEDRVAVRVLLTREGNFVVLSVQDHGYGIPAEEQKMIFERFFRGQSATHRPISGAGLGLSIVQHIVQSHGGSLDVESRPGEGSTFRVKLPLRETA